ncbi:hypothetical protein [Bacillus pumilus]|uniref:hypothetical protein n=1 Tax=Bacillus pumilus TaxID=1408 RepID=UPI00164316FB|nr:hypothetical protein [Bacillus pumilus]
MSEAFLFLLGWFLGSIQGIAVAATAASERKSKEENERKKYEELKKKYESN